MNTAVVILAVLLIFIVLYFVYVRFLQNTTVVSQLNLNSANPPIKMSSLSNPTSPKFSYSLWLYVNNPISETKTIFTTFNNGGFSIVVLKINGNTLQVDVTTNEKGYGTVHTYTLTKNFSLQSWEHIILSFSETGTQNIMDCYQNGKLVNSFTLPGQVVSLGSANQNAMITFGTIDANVNKFEWFPTVMDPQTAWAKYLNGNGTSSILPNYGMYMSLIKNQNVSKKYTIF